MIFGMPLSYSQGIIPPPSEPPTPPFHVPLYPPNQTFPSGTLDTKKPSQERWDILAPMPSPRTEVAVAAIGEKIYVIGGFNRSSQTTDTVEVYNTITNTWHSASSLPIKLHHVGAASFSDEIYVVGGFLDGWIPTDSLFIYNPEKDSWR